MNPAHLSPLWAQPQAPTKMRPCFCPPGYQSPSWPGVLGASPDWRDRGNQGKLPRRGGELEPGGFQWKQWVGGGGGGVLDQARIKLPKLWYGRLN